MLFEISLLNIDVLLDAVFALWNVPELLPAFMLKGGEVSRFLIGGADLMFPGISVPAEGLPSFLAGEPWAVKVPGNPAPIAVSTFFTLFFFFFCVEINKICFHTSTWKTLSKSKLYLYMIYLAAGWGDCYEQH
jgi:hypothetical protein